eukprot:jgi/Hompol1/4813/HPOL_003897-RA
MDTNTPANDTICTSAGHQTAQVPQTKDDKQPDEEDEPTIIEYVPENLVDQVKDSPFEAFADVFAKFAPSVTVDDEDVTNEAVRASASNNGADGEDDDDEDMDLDEDDDDALDGTGAKSGSTKPMSKKQKRKASRLSVAELKQLVRKPDVVEWVDVTATDPKLLAHIKSYRNTVPVPPHWSQKRKYLQGKRGLEKMPFDLPDFIKQTGITQMRDAVKEKEDASKLKTKTRERLAPKMGKIVIDYQKLHDAFFRWQTRPKLSNFGEVYYEGKEFETKLKLRKPGQLSDDLRLALNIPPLAPPPWLINMQRYGPPPSYPQLIIPGLNAPIPEGAQWGYHPGGWGKPPVDEFNRPLYGDVFGVSASNEPTASAAPIERELWGEFEEPEEEEEDEEEPSDDEEDGEEEGDGDGGRAGATAIPDGLITPSGLSSVPSGLETPEFIELRKNRPVSDSAPKPLYTVLEQKENAIRGFMGSQHVYDLSATTASATAAATAPTASESASAKAAAAKRKLGIVSSAIEVALNPEDLAAGLDDSTLKRKFDQEVTAVRSEAASQQYDFSDLVQEHQQKQERKRQKNETGSASAGSKRDKSKEFKF